jgi:hypothetical protein
MLSDFLTSAFQVYRASWDTDSEGNAYSEEQFVEEFYGHLQQANMQLTQAMGMSLLTTFSIWCSPDTNVLPGDTIIYGDLKYSVKAKQEFLTGDNQHFELLVESDGVVEGS